MVLLWFNDFQRIIQFGYLPLNAYILIDYHVSQWPQCKSMGNLILIHTFDFFSKSDGQIHSKLGSTVPWVCFYQVCSNGQAPMIFWISQFTFSFPKPQPRFTSHLVGMVPCVGLYQVRSNGHAAVLFFLTYSLP